MRICLDRTVNKHSAVAANCVWWTKCCHLLHELKGIVVCSLDVFLILSLCLRTAHPTLVFKKLCLPVFASTMLCRMFAENYFTKRQGCATHERHSVCMAWLCISAWTLYTNKNILQPKLSASYFVGRFTPQCIQVLCESFIRHKTQKICYERRKKLLKRFQKNAHCRILFTIEKIFNIEEKFNRQNDCVYDKSCYEAKDKIPRVRWVTPPPPLGGNGLVMSFNFCDGVRSAEPH